MPKTTPDILKNSTFSPQEFEREKAVIIQEIGQVSDTPSSTFTSLFSGAYHTCGINTSGNIECWGYNDEGQVSDTPSFIWERGQNCFMRLKLLILSFGLGL